MQDLVEGPDGVSRCWWCTATREYTAYHDDEWGHRVSDEHRLFEKLCLEGFQAGLSWLTILRKREAFRSAFAGFDAEQVARFGDADVERLMNDAGIVRNHAKILASIANARALVGIHEQGGALRDLVWSFAPEASPAAPRTRADIPVSTPESRALSRALKTRGFRFVGPTTVYAFMQAMGLVNDHLAGCAFR